MQKKYLYGSLIAFLGIISVWQLAANAQTWSGPKTGCSDPSQTNCNVDGVVWNRSNFATAPVQTGNYKLDGSAQMGQDLKVGKDMYLLNNSTALRLDLAGSTSTINVGNWASSDNPNYYPVQLNVYGSINAMGVNHNQKPQITGYSVKGTNNLCIGADCRTSWPSGGGGGGTVTSVGSGNGLTGGPISGAGTLSVIGCTNGQVLKANATNQWACGTDIDTNSGGTIGTINSPDTSITVTGGSGPTTGLALNTTYADGRYLKVTGGSGNGNYDFTGNVAGYGSPFIVTNNGGGIGGTFTSQMMGLSARSTETVTGNVAYGLRGITESNSGVGVYGDGSGLSGSVSGIGVAGRGYIGVYGRTANTGVAGIGGMFSANRYGVAIRADGQYGIMVSSTNYGFGGTTGPALWAESVNGNTTILANKDIVTKSGRFCLNNGANPATDCVSAWPSGGAGTITGVTAGTGLTGGGTSGNVTLNVTDNYVNTTGDTMTGNLTLGIIKLQASPAQFLLDQPVNTNGPLLWSRNGPSTGKNTLAHLSNVSVAGEFAYTNATPKTLTHVYLADSTEGVDAYASNLSGSNAGKFSYLDAGGNAQYLTYLGNSNYALDATGPVRFTGDVSLNGSTSDLSIGGSVGVVAGTKAIITSYTDNFSSGSFSGNGRWGMFKNGSALVMGVPDITGVDNEFQVSKFTATGGSSLLFAIRSDNGNTFVPVGDFYVQGAGKTAYKPGGGSWASTSDVRLKKDIKPITHALDKLENLKGVEFNWINPEDHGNDANRQGGFIAQDIEKYFPNWVTETDVSGEDAGLVGGAKAKAINLPFEYDALVVESIKELKAQNDMLQAENNALLKRIEAIEAKLK